MPKKTRKYLPGPLGKVSEAVWEVFGESPESVERVFSDSGVNKSARERIGRRNLSQKVPSKKGSLGVIFSPRNCRETHTQNRQILREDTLGATRSAGPFCLLPRDCSRNFVETFRDSGSGGPGRYLRDFFGVSGPKGPRDLCKGQAGSQVTVFIRSETALIAKKSGVSLAKIGKNAKKSARIG